MRKYNETQLVQTQRTKLAYEYIIHELSKLLCETNSRVLSETIRRLVPRSESENVSIRDFWNLFSALSSMWKLKDLPTIVTDEKVTWTKEQIAISSLRPQTQQGWMRGISPNDFDAAILYLRDKSKLDEALKDPEEYEKTHPWGMETDAIIAIENHPFYDVCDGNGRLAHAILRWAAEGETYPYPRMVAWIGRRIGRARNCWIPTSSLFSLKGALIGTGIDVGNLVKSISSLAFDEYQERVKSD